MIYNWYKIFNINTFNSLNLVSKEYQVFLDPYGYKSILVTKSNHINVVFDDFFFPILLSDFNPRVKNNKAAYVDANNDVWIGYQVEE